ncbi:MOSC domain-containing protein [Amylibacter sp. IMCC11727]|uniref:MOSC domain-containing protein n=1 Tax=Amylibacter sp. IMCC11727 TaxID=3039851 RepID=UPI00244DFEF2|nr:MOSC domain-containing protein [Amylibacter sp. IMCC11727]WGI21695.1 MOSC domain-containing protein [Amylibacter sp. IMCC11727]
MITVTELFRHPVKSHGREALSAVTLTQGKTMPWDRVWAVAHDMAKFDDANPAWAHCVNFSRGAKAPELMAINVTVNESTNELTFTHPSLDPLTINPDLPADSAKLVAWTKPIMPADRAPSDRIVRAPDRGMTDTPFPSISINSHASLADLSATAGTQLSPLRWRGNIWVDGAAPWDEFNWIGRHARIGGALLKIVDPITRCPATTANPETGKRDVDTLKVLSETYGHKDFGVYAEVVETGEIKTGDRLELI